MSEAPKQTIEVRVLRMSEAEADAWLADLMVHIRKQHRHLYDPEDTGLSVRGTPIEVAKS